MRVHNSHRFIHFNKKTHDIETQIISITQVKGNVRRYVFHENVDIEIMIEFS